MGEIVNLQRIRKQRAKAAAAKDAAENRVRHGRTGAARQTEALEAARRKAALDGAKKDPEP